MGNKNNQNNKNNQVVKSNTTHTGGKEENAKVNNLAFKITALTLAVVTVVVLIVGLALSLGKKQVRLDYMEDKLSQYLSISREDYAGFEAKIDIPALTEQDLNDAIISVLYNNRVAPEELTDFLNLTISVGDAVNIYYRGYTLNDDGSKNYFDGGCNFNSSSPTSLEIGSGSFVSGFEYNLIGKNQKNYATMTKLAEGIVKSTDTVLITYSVTYSDGESKKSQSAIVDLSDPNLDKKWGVGFSEFWSSNEIIAGTTYDIEVETVKETEGVEKDVYSDVSVSEIYRVKSSEERPVLLIESKFPYNYTEESLCNKTAYFETYIVSARDYTVPELNDEFITEALGISEESLADYKGDGIVEKYKNSLFAQLEEERREAIEDAVATIFWDHVVKITEYKKLPNGDVSDYYDSLYSELESMYSQYQSYYNDIDTFAIAYMGLSSGDDWEAELLASAEESIKQKLVFYYIIRQEGYIPSDAEYQALYQKMFDEQVEAYLEYMNVEKTDDDYADKLETAREQITRLYDEEYWEMQITYKYGMSKICNDLADIKNSAEE